MLAPLAFISLAAGLSAPLDGGSPDMVLAPYAHNSELEISPDGKKLIFQSQDEDTSVDYIFVMDISSKKIEPLGPGRDASFSSDGKKIVFVLEPADDVQAAGEDEEVDSEIYVMDASGSNRKRLTTDDAVQVDPCFGPEDKEIYCAESLSGDFADMRIAKLSASGGKTTAISKPGAWCGSPSVVPALSVIAFATEVPIKGQEDTGIGIALGPLRDVPSADIVFEPKANASYYLPRFNWQGSYGAVEKMNDEGVSNIIVFSLAEDSTDEYEIGPLSGVDSFAVSSDGQTVYVAVAIDGDGPARIGKFEKGKNPVWLTNTSK
jgi:dipeptidyl aminopeptidase/acylaminoacyl peptidase